MFDIGFFEMLVIALVALLVLGPERMPQAIRTVGVWIQRARNTMGSLQGELERELKLQEVQQRLTEEKKKLTAMAQPEQATPRASTATADSCDEQHRTPEKAQHAG